MLLGENYKIHENVQICKNIVLVQAVMENRHANRRSGLLFGNIVDICTVQKV